MWIVKNNFIVLFDSLIETWNLVEFNFFFKFHVELFLRIEEF